MTRPLLAAGAAVAMLVIATAASGARGFSDPGGDTNAAPDLTSLDISDSGGTLTIRIGVGNYPALPTNSWLNVWFDTDANSDTGDDAGDEALVRYRSEGTTEVFAWNGSQYAATAAAGVAATYSGGALTISVPRTTIHAAGALGVLVVGSRGQPVGDAELVASDFLPEVGRAQFAGPAPAAFTDAAGDHDAAPDISAVRVSDSKSGWITFAITTPNYEVLPEQSAIVISIDADDNPRTGESGADLQLSLAAGEIAMERWNGDDWAPDELPTRARHRNAANVVSIDLHASELANRSRFRFSLLSADFSSAIQGVVAVDLAPDDFTFWRYALVNRPALRLTVTRLFARPAQPQAGKPFAVHAAVSRSDTQRPIASGSVRCRASVGGKAVAAKGSVTGGSARCALVVPGGAKGKALRGTITVRTGGTSVSRRFAYVVR